MAIKPIDLQTLFLQLGQVGKQQSASKEGTMLQEAMRGAVTQKLEDEAAKAVRRPEDDEIQSESIKSEPEGGQQRREGKKKGHEDETAEPPEPETVRDPALGSFIDISG